MAQASRAVSSAIVDPTEASLAALESQGFNLFTGVACSLLAPLITRLSHTEGPTYIPAVREDAAVGLAAGAYIGGAWPCVLMQNSGFGYCLNVLTSLNLIYAIPTLLIVGYRGYQGRDAPEHLVMGRTCEAILKAIGVPRYVPDAATMADAIHAASRWMRRHLTPAAVLVRQGIFTHDQP